MVRVASQDELTHKNTGQVTAQPIFASSKKKIEFESGIFKSSRFDSKNSNPFCHAFSLSLSLPHVTVPSRSSMVVSQINSNCLVKSLPWQHQIIEINKSFQNNLVQLSRQIWDLKDESMNNKNTKDVFGYFHRDESSNKESYIFVWNYSGYC